MGVTSMILMLMGALAAAGEPGVAGAAGRRPAGPAVAATVEDPVEKEYRKLMEDDDAAQDEVDKWIRDAEEFARKGAEGPSNSLGGRVRQRFDGVKKAYENFLSRNPKHARARLAYGSFLQDIGEEEDGVKQMERSRELDPRNPAAWNNLANYYGHRGPVKKAFEYYAKASELAREEPTYYWNLATTVYLFRKDAREFYQLNEEQVFDKALELYRRAIQHDPTNFVLATDYAESFYGTNPMRLEDGMKAWRAALKIARDEVEREGVSMHFARINIYLGNFEEARRQLGSITNAMYQTLKGTLGRKLERDEAAAKGKGATAAGNEAGEKEK